MRLVVLIAVLAATASAAEAADRYGASNTPPQPQSQVPGAPARQGSAPPAPHMLSWSGKTQPSEPAPPPVRQADARPQPMALPPPRGAWTRPGPGTPPGSPGPAAAYQPQRYAGPTNTPAPQAAPPTGLYGSGQTPTESQYQPRAQVPAPQQPAQNTAYNGGARFYSVHREYGVSPDPIPAPLAQPFFNGQQADLAEPPPPVDPRTPAQQRAASSAAGNGVATARPGSQGGDWGASDDPGLAAGDASQGLSGQTTTDTGLGSGHP